MAKNKAMEHIQKTWMVEMTGEEKAEEIANERCKEQMCWGRCNIHKNHHCGYWHYNYECALKGIEYGLAEGKPKWHDLRKNPEDLPKLEDKRFPWSITVANQDGEACEYNYRLSRWQNCLGSEIDEPIVWTELPKFEE